MAKTTGKPIATSRPQKLAKMKAIEAEENISNKKNRTPVEMALQEEPAAEKAIKPKSDTSDDKSDVSIEQKLIALYNLQQIDSQVDRIRIIRGELPLEVQDLEDEIAGLETRVDNHIQDTVMMERSILEKKNSIKESGALIKKYEEQQMNVRNNREYDSLSKEIEFQHLEIQLSEKRIKEFQHSLDLKRQEIEKCQTILNEKRNDLEIKKNELDDIIAETEKEENELIRRSEENQQFIEERLLTAYSRIRKNARNGLAVVQIERDACGGCFNKIPPQHQLDIRMHKKIIVCEYCGRILVDDGTINAMN
jgi:predicted  nucleic acid-binding Zn-ribbon protein